MPEVSVSPASPSSRMSSVLPSERYHTEPATQINRVIRTFGHSALDALGITEGVLLDLGCASGMTTVELAAIFGVGVQVIGVERDGERIGTRVQEALAYYQRNGAQVNSDQVSFFQADAYARLAFIEDHSVRATFMMNNIFDAIKDKKLSTAELQSICEVLVHQTAPGGYVIFSGGKNFCIVQMPFQKGQHPQLVRENGEMSRFSSDPLENVRVIQSLWKTVCSIQFT